MASAPAVSSAAASPVTRRPLDILVVTGRFPMLSQSFIERKVIGLARRGQRVTVLAGGRGDHELDPHVVGALGGGLHVEYGREGWARGLDAIRGLGRDPWFAIR